MSRIGLLFALLIVPVALSAQVATPLILGPVAWCGGTTPPKSLQSSRPCELGDVLHVAVTNLDVWMSADKDKNKLSDLVLVLNGRVLKGLSPYQDGSDSKLIDFDLRRLSDADPDGKENRAGWTALLSGSKYANILDVAVALGGVPPNFGGAKVAFNAFPRAQTVFVAAFMAALLVAFFLLARKSDILRDAPAPAGEPRRSYSLARCQMAWWFFIVVASFHFIWIVTGDRDTLTSGELILIGISAATGMGAFRLDSSKRDQRQSLTTERTALVTRIAEITAALAAVPAPAAADADGLRVEQLQKQTRIVAIDAAVANLPSPPGPSEGLALDILRDETGISFHRFQMAAWTVVLGFVFVVTVYRTLAMPDFSPTLLGLMGISAGTYIGFKIPDPAK